MEKLDFKKELRQLYGQSAKAPSVVDVPPLQFLRLDGRGDPNTSEQYQQSVETLFSLSYTLKFAVKKGPTAIDYGVMPLESLWYGEGDAALDAADKSSWSWTAQIMQPDLITAEMIAQAMDALTKKKALPLLETVRFETITEGHAAQILHIGPFTDEAPTVEALHRFITDAGFTPAGSHHEIYLSDIRRAAPAKWKTIIRQPVA